MATEWTLRTRVFLNWTQSNIIRLQELRFDLHCSFNLFVNAWPRLWPKKFTDVAWQKSWKSRHRSCEVCLTFLNLSLCLKSSSNTRRALFRAFNIPRPLMWGPWNTGYTVYQAWGGSGWENLRNFWVKMWLRGRHQDTKIGWKARWSEIFQDLLWGVWLLRTLEKDTLQRFWYCCYTVIIKIIIIIINNNNDNNNKYLYSAYTFQC